MDTADFPASVEVTGRLDLLVRPGWLAVDGGRVDLASVRSVYRRHPARFGFPEQMSDPERRFATLESLAGIGGLLTAQPWRWLDAPGAVADAAYKPRQLRVAVDSGLRVPRSLVTTVADEVRAFAQEVGGPIVYKSLSTGLVVEPDGLKIVYTTLVDPADLDDVTIGLCPHLFQEWVPKDHDVRLTAVGDRLFPVAVHADSDQARVDWRSRYDDLRYEACGVPDRPGAGVSAPVRVALRGVRLLRHPGRAVVVPGSEPVGALGVDFRRDRAPDRRSYFRRTLRRSQRVDRRRGC